jgi:hexulose-6-phosphate isomerase
MMRKSISEWCFPATMSMADRMALARDAGFEGIEVALTEDPDGSLKCLGLLTVEAMEQQAEAIRDAAERAGIAISGVATGLHWAYSLTDDDPQVRAKSLALTDRLLYAGALLGADTVLVIPGTVAAPFGPQKAPVPYDVCYERAQDAVRRLLPRAAELKVKLGLEPVWNMFLLSPLEWRSFVDSFESEWVSIYFDCGNVLLTGFPEQWIRILGPRITRVHVKDFKRSVGTLAGFCHLLEGDVNWPEVMTALREVGYDGWLTAEVGPQSPYAPEHLIHVTAQAMERILRM